VDNLKHCLVNFWPCLQRFEIRLFYEMVFSFIGPGCVGIIVKGLDQKCVAFEGIMEILRKRKRKKKGIYKRLCWKAKSKRNK
jgi:hypothetical protein